MLTKVCPSPFLGWYAFFRNIEGHFLLNARAHCIDISGITKSGSWMLTNQKLSNYYVSSDSERGCPKFDLSGLIRPSAVVENGVKTASIVHKLAHRVMQLLCQWAPWLKSYSWKTIFASDRNSVDPHSKMWIKCWRIFVFSFSTYSL